MNDAADRDKFASIFGQKLEDALSDRQMSVYKLSNRVKLAQGTLWSYIKGRTLPDVYNFIQITNALKANNYIYFFERSEEHLSVSVDDMLRRVGLDDDTISAISWYDQLGVSASRFINDLFSNEEVFSMLMHYSDYMNETGVPNYTTQEMPVLSDDEIDRVKMAQNINVMTHEDALEYYLISMGNAVQRIIRERYKTKFVEDTLEDVGRKTIKKQIESRDRYLRRKKKNLASSHSDDG